MDLRGKIKVLVLHKIGIMLTSLDNRRDRVLGDICAGVSSRRLNHDKQDQNAAMC